jgi:hypothetical protein
LGSGSAIEYLVERILLIFGRFFKVESPLKVLWNFEKSSKMVKK